MTRAGVPGSAWPLSGRAIWRSFAGYAIAPSATITTAMVSTGHLVMIRIHRRGTPMRVAGLGFRAGRTRGRNLSPPNPSKAGTRVRAMRTATATATAAAMPIVDRNGMPATDNPTSAIITVSPANTTADPAVARARAADSSGSRPSRSWSRWREVMNSA